MTLCSAPSRYTHYYEVGDEVRPNLLFTHDEGRYIGLVGTVVTHAVRGYEAPGRRVQAVVQFDREDLAHSCGHHPYIVTIPMDCLSAANEGDGLGF